MKYRGPVFVTIQLVYTIARVLVLGVSIPLDVTGKRLRIKEAHFEQVQKHVQITYLFSRSKFTVLSSGGLHIPGRSSTRFYEFARKVGSLLKTLQNLSFLNEVMRISGLKNLIFLNKYVFPSVLLALRWQ
jgi:hypothetical protein